METSFTTADGLPQNSVTCIAQTPDGYLWLGTFGGLARFDGQRFEVFDMANTPALLDNRILSLCADSGGTLWIGTEAEGVVLYLAGSFERLPPEVTPEGRIWDIVEDLDGAIWVGGESVVQFIGNDFLNDAVRWASLPGIEKPQVRDLLVDRQGTLWVSTANGVARLRSGCLERVDDRNTWKLIEYADGTLWADRYGCSGVWNGVGFVDPPAVNPKDVLWASLIDRDGRTWIGAESGAFVVCGDPSGSGGERPQLATDTQFVGPVRALYEDREGNIWLGTDGSGLVRLRPAPFELFRTERPDRPLMITAGTENVLLMTASGGLKELTPDGLRRFLPHPGPQPSRHAVTARDGALWFPASGTQLFRWDGQELQAQDHDLPGPLTRLLEDRSGTLWIGAENKLGRLREGVIDSIAIPEMGHVIDMREGPDGALWFLGGGPVLGKYANDWLELWTAEDGLPPGRPRALHIDSSGVAWYTTYGSGLVRVEGLRIDVLTSAQGLPDESLGGLLEDAQGRFWINSNRGVFYVSRAELEACALNGAGRARCFRLLTGEGNGGSACKTPDGSLWFPTIDGVVQIRSELAHHNPTPPEVVIERVTVDEVTYALSSELIVPPGADRLQIDYTSPTFSAPELARFRYQLEGHDDGWIEAGARRSASYTDIAPGHYRFRVTACNENLVWNPVGASLELRLQPRFSQTRLFALIVALAALGAAFVAHLWRLRTLERHNRALKQEIEVRERAVARSEAFAQRLAEGQRLESVGRLAGGIAHDFNNILTVLMGRAELLSDGPDASPDVIDQAREIQQCGERAEALIRQLLVFSRQQVLHPRVVDPNQVLQDLEPMISRVVPENITFELEIGEPVGHVEVDPGQLDQVLLNLVVNARDAMPNGGKLIVSTRRAPPSDGAFMEITVRDTGVGISEEDLPHLFEPFFTTKGQGQGTGLGLASVHGIVEQSGGDVQVDSQLGMGARFRIRLPLSEKELEPPVMLEPYAQGLDARGETVLVCDDDAAVLRTTEAALARSGYRVLAANHPQVALQLARDHASSIDLLITDVVMPGMCGEELVQAVIEELGELPTLYVSGYASPEHHEQAKQPGVLLLLKPYTRRALLSHVRELLDAAQRLDVNTEPVT